MQSEEAKNRRLEWGNKHCDHPNFVKEYYFGAQTGDFICSQCGREFTKEEKNKIESNRP